MPNSTIEQQREGAPKLERSFFQQRADEVGLTTAKVTEYIASIGDQDKQAEAQAYWDEVEFVGRLDPHVVATAEYAGLADEQLDTIYYIGT